jgi:hypothetical protein
MQKNGRHFTVLSAIIYGCRMQGLRPKNLLTVLSVAIRIGIKLLIAPLDKVNEILYGKAYMYEIWSDCRMNEVKNVKTQADRIKKQLDEGNINAFKLDLIEYILKYK